MRHIVIQVAQGQGETVTGVALEHDAVRVARWQGQSQQEPLDIVSVEMPNRGVGAMLEALQGLPGLSVSLVTREIIVFEPPARRMPDYLKNLQARSPMEVFVHSLQSISAWPSFIGYAVAGALVVWIAFYTDSIYLLVAAMLISPFAGPAMRIAVATATGDSSILGRSLIRYLAAIATAVVVSAALSYLFGQEILTDLMVQVGTVSAVAFMLPLVAGAAGALNLVQPERASLVTGAAVGVLVTVSLAPPAGLIGMSLAMGAWEVVLRAAFLLALQLVGINLGGAIVFRLYGLTPDLARYRRGQQRVRVLSLLASLLAMAGLLALQFSGPLNLQRSSRVSSAEREIRQVVQDSQLAKPIEVNARFPTPLNPADRTLLATVYVQRAPDVRQTASELSDRLRILIKERLRQTDPELVPLVDVTVLDRTPATGSSSN